MRNLFILASLLLGTLICVAQDQSAQNAPPQDQGADRSTPAPALSGIAGMDAAAADDDASSEMPQIPSMLGGRGASLAFGAESERSNFIRGGVNVGAAFDDNAQLAPSNGEGNVSYNVFPSIAIEQTRSRMRWSLGYAAGLTVNQRLSNNNQGSHDLSLESEFRLSPHVSLRVAEDFTLTSAVFDGGIGALVLPGGDPNSGLIAPLSSRRAINTTVGISYHYALKDVVGASGSFYDLHYNDVPVGTLIVADTRTVSGGAYWLHRLFQHDWAGLSYDFERLTFDPNGETKVHSFTVVNTLSIAKKFTLTGFIGPQYSDNQGVAAGGVGAGTNTQFNSWSVAGGVEAGWQSERASVVAGYTKRVNNGGGITGAVRLQNVHATVRRELFPGWAGSVGMMYGRNESLTIPVAGAPTDINTTSVLASLERNLGKSFGFRLGYSHDFQTQAGSTDTTRNFDANRNRYFVTLSYQWARPLGR